MSTEWPPSLPATPLDAGAPLASLARQLLAEVGGIASARHIRDAIAAHGRGVLTIRQTRDLLRSPRVCKLGAGYFATQDTVFEPVLCWTEAHLHQSGAMSVAQLIAAVLDHYPRGDAQAIRCWLQQEPGRLQLGAERVRLTPQRWRAS